MDLQKNIASGKALAKTRLSQQRRPSYAAVMVHALTLPRLLCRALVAVVFLTLAATTARAEFAVCNQSFDVVNVAIGQDVAGDFQTEGWWTIGPNQCANVIKDELTSRYIYIYAQDVFGQPIMPGTTQMCISPRKFTIRGITECWARGHVAAGFIEVDTQKTQRWSLFLAATP